MHAPETARPTRTPDDLDGVLDFLWLELTNRCNLQCVHCYTESSPQSGERDLLSTADYEDVMRQAHALGCRKIQFIGGEPQLNRAFDHLLRAGVGTGFEFVEVFTNLTKLDEATVDFAAETGVCFATSVYSDDPDVHDAVTTVRGSHRRTIGNLRRLIDRGVTTRAGVITMTEDDEATDRTVRFLHDMGVGHVRASGAREFGRGEDIVGREASDEALCGHCWNGSLALAPDGRAYPCVMARDHAVGDTTVQTLAEIVRGAPLAGRRDAIYERVWLPKTARAESPFCHQSCVPDLSCPCDPLLCQQSCAPWDAQVLPE
jgi:MoaA/NifB/PqqE/SkfB family radical SAM enzyme